MSLDQVDQEQEGVPGPQQQGGLDQGATPESAPEVSERKTPAMQAREASQAAAPGEDYATASDKLSPAGKKRIGAPPMTLPVPESLTKGFSDDLSDVLLHFGTGKPEEMGAQAFTEGRDIYLADDAPPIASAPGRKLVGHELGHVVQQDRGKSPEKPDDQATPRGVEPKVPDPESAKEGEAEAAGEDVVAGKQPKVTQAAEPGRAQKRGGTGPSPEAIEAARSRNQDRGSNRTGNFNVAGTSTGKDYEFVNRGGKYYVRAKPQATKDRNTVAAQGEDPNATKKDGGTNVSAEANLQIYKKDVSASVYSTKEGGETLAEGSAGKLTGELDVLKASAGVEAGGTISAEGVEVKAGANVGITLVGGKLCWTLPTIKFDILGEQMEAVFGTELTAEVAASAKGEVGLAAGKTDKGVKVAASAGGEAFAGAKAGFKLFGKGLWHTPKGPEDVLGAYAGVEGWAGAAAAAKFTASLIPSVKFEGYLGAAVGVGASAKVGVEAQVVNIARLGYILAKKGLPMAWQGLENYADQVGEWLATGAAELYDIGTEYVDAVSTSLLGDDDAVKFVARGLHKHLSPSDRAAYISRMLNGTCWDAEEDAIIKIVKDSKDKGDMWRVLSRVEGGTSRILWKLDGAQDTEFRQLTGM